jgi:hypothetical protein
MTFSQASGRASVELSEHEHSAVQTLTEHRDCRDKHSSRHYSCRGRCLLGHVHIFRSMSISLCETSYVVNSDVSHDVPKVFFFNDVLLNVLERTHIGITTFQYPTR